MKLEFEIQTSRSKVLNPEFPDGFQVFQFTTVPRVAIAELFDIRLIFQFRFLNDLVASELTRIECVC